MEGRHIDSPVLDTEHVVTVTTNTEQNENMTYINSELYGKN